MQNGYIESFNGRMRDELLNESLFVDLDQARELIGDWLPITTLRGRNPRWATKRRLPMLVHSPRRSA